VWPELDYGGASAAPTSGQVFARATDPWPASREHAHTHRQLVRPTGDAYTLSPNTIMDDHRRRNQRTLCTRGVEVRRPRQNGNVPVGRSDLQTGLANSGSARYGITCRCNPTRRKSSPNPRLKVDAMSECLNTNPSRPGRTSSGIRQTRQLRSQAELSQKRVPKPCAGAEQPPPTK